MISAIFYHVKFRVLVKVFYPWQMDARRLVVGAQRAAHHAKDDPEHREHAKTLPGRANLYLCGQWVEPGGMVPICAMSGRNAIWLLCHADRRPFEAALP
jgi:phytoene dehydrogenase-like protein